MDKRGVCLVEAEEFSFTIDDGIITISGNIESRDFNVIEHLQNNTYFKSLSTNMRIGVANAVTAAMEQQTQLSRKNTKILNKFGYVCDTQHISWNEFIPIQKVVIGGTFYDVDVEGLKDVGYGITRFEIANDSIVTSHIQCYGRHPNVRRSLCIGAIPSGKPMTLDRLNEIRIMLTVANLDSCYDSHTHMCIIKPHIL